MKIHIILWIAIVFSAVSSQDENDPVFEEGDNTRCCLRASRELFGGRPSEWVYIRETWWVPTPVKFTTKGNSTTPEMFEVCTSDWSEELICRCSYGWTGKSCDEPRFCTVSQPINDMVSEPGSDHRRPSPDSDKKRTSSQEWCIGETKSDRYKKKLNCRRLNAVAKDVQSKWKKLPKCKPACLGKIDLTNFVHTQFKKMTYHAIPIDSPCNKEASPVNSIDVLSSDFLKKYQFYLIGSAIGIILFAMVVCIVCVRRKKRKIQNTNENGMPMVPNQQNYMEENLIYNS